MDTRNFLSTENPYKLAAPPAWWLQKLSDYDTELVVFPSRHRMAYILARRRHHSNAIAELDALDKRMVQITAGLDGDVMAQHNLIYVRHLIGDSVRRFEVFQWLRDSDTKANGGGEAVAQKYEDAEADLAGQKRAALIDNIDHRARDAWRSYQARTGRRAGFTPSGSGRARAMPVGSFTSKESSVAMFVRE